MACSNCFDDCGDELSSDKCIKYTGEDVDALEICHGDSLRNIEDAIIAELLKLKTNTGNTLTGLTGCNSVLSLFDSDKTLKSIVQALITRVCSLTSSVSSIQSSIGSPYSFDVDCLDTLSSSSSKDEIIQAVITKVCEINTALSTISEDYVKSSDLNTLIANYLDGLSGDVTEQYLKAIPYVAYEYYGPLTNFDSTGKGLTSAGYTKMYLCNGANNTPDKRGRTAVGAIAGVPGGSLDAAVDPSLPANAGLNYALKDKFGASSIILSVPELPSHTHIITDPGHLHTYFTILTQGGGVGAGLANSHSHANEAIPNKSTSKATTGITVNSTGNSQPHSNLQPGIACYFIMFIP